MPRYIVKIGDRYGEWSTIVDSYVSKLLPLEKFVEEYRFLYGEKVINDLADRLKRVESKGVSSFGHSSVEDLLSENRAGENEESIPVADVITAWIKESDEPAEV
jgi:hypothetical protein